MGHAVGIGRVESLGDGVAYVRYSEGQCFAPAAWNASYLDFFPTLGEAVKAYCRETGRREKAQTAEAREDFPSESDVGTASSDVGARPGGKT